MEHAEVAARMGAAHHEILGFDETPAGLVVHHRDGTSYIDVPEDTPDANGKTGLMFLRAPEGYKDVPGAFPVYAQPVEETEAASPYDALTRDELVAIAGERGVTVDGRWGEARLREALVQADAEASAADGGD